MSRINNAGHTITFGWSPPTELNMHKDHVAEEGVTEYRSHMSKLANITRETAGWSVRIVRDGEQHSKYFRFSNGGIRKARDYAIRWRDQKLRELGTRQWRKGPRKRASNNTSGISGVSQNVYGRWVATWQEDGVQRFKTFRTKKEATAHRKQQLKQQQ